MVHKDRGDDKHNGGTKNSRRGVAGRRFSDQRKAKGNTLRFDSWGRAALYYRRSDKLLVQKELRNLGL